VSLGSSSATVYKADGGVATATWAPLWVRACASQVVKDRGPMRRRAARVGTTIRRDDAGDLAEVKGSSFE